MRASILLINPKFPHNVGASIRAGSIFGVEEVEWTGSRVSDPASEAGGRIPREERMREYRHVKFGRYTGLQGVELEEYIESDYTPVCVEISSSCEYLPNFEHPENAVYVFGPEDGSVPKGVRNACHRFVAIPSRSCLNLGAAVNVTLYDRCSKLGFPDKEW